MIERSALTNEDLAVVMKSIFDQRVPLDKTKIAAIAFDLSKTNERSEGSYLFALNRAHILIHGIVPYGESKQRGEQLFLVSDNMKQFARNEYGIEAEPQIRQAKTELAKRKQKPKKIDRQEAMYQVRNYYENNKHHLPKSFAKKHDVLTRLMMVGYSVEDAFNKILTDWS